MLRFVAMLLAVVALNAQNACPNDQRCGDCSANRCLACYESYANLNGVCVEPSQKVHDCL